MRTRMNTYAGFGGTMSLYDPGVIKAAALTTVFHRSLMIPMDRNQKRTAIHV